MSKRWPPLPVDANSILGVPVSETPPQPGQILVLADGKWTPSAGGGGDAESIKGVNISNTPSSVADVLKYDQATSELKFVDGDIGKAYIWGGSVSFSLETLTVLRTYNFTGRVGKRYLSLISFAVKSTVAAVDVEIVFNCLVNNNQVRSLTGRVHCQVANEFYMATASILNGFAYTTGLNKIFTYGRVATAGSGATITTSAHSYCPIEV